MPCEQVPTRIRPVIVISLYFLFSKSYAIANKYQVVSRSTMAQVPDQHASSLPSSPTTISVPERSEMRIDDVDAPVPQRDVLILRPWPHRQPPSPAGPPLSPPPTPAGLLSRPLPSSVSLVLQTVYHVVDYRYICIGLFDRTYFLGRAICPT